MKLTLPQLLSFNGGFVDTAGFLALHGLFTAHVTGNFVTVGTAALHGSSGAVAKLSALPVFCAVVVLARLATHRIERRPLRALLAAKLALLALGAGLAIAWGPFADPDAPTLFVTGMILVSAMALQNAAHRLYFASAPPTTLMTGSTTQIMLDLADLWRGGLVGEARTAARARARKLAASVAAFAVGCGAGALAYAALDCRAFLVAPVIALAVLLHGEARG